MGAGGPGNWKWALKSFVQVFEKKKKLSIGKTLFNLLYKSARSLPAPVVYGASF